MIQWLSDWLKEIVLVILLAAFVDLLLPNSSLQRYVKVVISLFILLTILSPIVTMLNSESELEIMMSNDPFQAQDPLLKTLNDGKVQSLQDIKGAGEKLTFLHNEQSLQFIESQMEEMIQSQLIEKLPDHMIRVDVETNINEGEVTPEVQRIQVNLASSKEQITGSKSSKTPVHIEPVSIQVHVGEDTEKIENSLNRSENQKSIEIERISEQVYRIITENWNLPSDKIEFIYDP